MEAVAYRGIDNLMIAKVLKDTVEEYLTDTPKQFAPVATLSKTPNSSTGEHSFDNQVMIIVNSEGSDEIKVTCALPSLKDFAEYIGKSYDETTGMMVDSDAVQTYFALGYRTKLTDGSYRYEWMHKVNISAPSQSHNTIDGGTDISTLEFTIKALKTIHPFAKGKLVDGIWKAAPVKGITVDEKMGLSDLSTFFDEVITPDTLQPLTDTSLSVTSIAGSAIGKTLIKVTPAKGNGNNYKYKTGATLTTPKIGSVLDAGYTGWNGTEEITATTGNKILVAEVDASNKVVKYGITTVISKETA